MPLPYGWARSSTVIQSPASRAARRRSCQVRSGSVGERPLEQAEGEPARPRARARGTAGRRRTAAASARSRARRLPEAAGDGGHERPADAVDRADARARRSCCPRGTPGRRGAPGPRRRAAANASGSPIELRERRCPSASASALWAATKRDGALRWSGSASAAALVIAAPCAPGRAPASVGERHVAVALLEARACGPRRRRRTRRSPSRGPRRSRGVDDPAGGVDDAPADRGDPALGADRACRAGRAAELDAQPGGQAPVVLADQRPGHDLVEDRAHDPAVGDAVPALEAALERRARSSTGRGRRGGRGAGRAR